MSAPVRDVVVDRGAVGSFWRSAPGLGWEHAEKLVAVGLTVLIASRILVQPQISLGYLASIALAPVWLPSVLRVKPARVLLATVGLCLFSGVALALWRSVDHTFDRRQAIVLTLELVGVAASCGAMAWTYRTLGAPTSLVLFALASLVFVNRDSALYSVSPWRFGFALPTTLLLLALASFARRQRVEVITLGATVLLFTIGGGRSASATQCVALIVFLYWAQRSREKRPAMSISLVGVLLVLLTWAVYNIAQALILEGILGEAAQQRSDYQLQAGSGLLLGGRPELGATADLIWHRFWGIGLGIRPNWYDIQIGRDGMAAVGYNPINGYVNSYMFGQAFRLHSIAGDLWATFGLGGLLLTCVIGWHAVAAVASGPRVRGADTLLLTAAAKTLWNLAFSPWLTSIPMLTILMSLLWYRATLTAERSAAKTGDYPSGELRELSTEELSWSRFRRARRRRSLTT